MATTRLTWRARNSSAASLGPKSYYRADSNQSGYPWRRIILLNVLLGYIFSDRVQAITKVFGNLAWVMIGIIGAVIFGWKIIQYLLSQDSVNKNDLTTRQQASRP
jgi:uncharacterized membrane protein YeaQ/YmgE (transglycosylase-associated protein family)